LPPKWFNQDEASIMIPDPAGGECSGEHSDIPTRLVSRHIACAEIAAGNERTASLLELPGLVAWVHSVPVGPVDAGGDVHYVSLCPSCIVSRIALADVSGHGQAVAALGEKLRELMKRHLRELSQVELMRELNQAVREELGDVHYATMVAVGWHSRRGLLVMTTAGHPPPLWYRALRQEWRWLEARRASERGRLAGVPLGLLDNIHYDRTVVNLQLGDLIVLYSDGASEATNPVGDELGQDGLMSIARGLDARSTEAFGAQLTAAISSFRAGGEPLDDQTIIVLRRNDA
jgi:phosphoserine phosphatase RsbU/P